MRVSNADADLGRMFRIAAIFLIVLARLVAFKLVRAQDHAKRQICCFVTGDGGFRQCQRYSRALRLADSRKCSPTDLQPVVIAKLAGFANADQNDLVHAAGSCLNRFRRLAESAGKAGNFGNPLDLFRTADGLSRFIRKTTALGDENDGYAFSGTAKSLKEIEGRLDMTTPNLVLI